MHWALLSATIIVTTDSSFNFSHNSYQQMMHVVEGVPEIRGEDSLTVLVSRNWYGDAVTGDHLTVNCSRTMSQIGDIQGIFMVDSSLNLRGYGEVRDGFYVMKPFSSPNILTTDDLSLLSRGEVPRFNQHESHITVHFPLSDR
ncbi:hypothetical protein CSA37_09220 [Candidatus Fermentibacteria bacterium]|nr:MAG: hypothetical protein CSA37_09220 [Candidatus Fermentibacteria bacterium]